MDGLEFAKAEDRGEQFVKQINEKVGAFQLKTLGIKMESVFEEYASACSEVQSVVSKAEEYYREALKNAKEGQKSNIRGFYSKVKNCGIDARNEMAKIAADRAHELSRKTIVPRK